MTNPIYQVVSRAAFMLKTPQPETEVVSELLHGECVEQLSVEGDYIKAKNLSDGYEGYVHKVTLSKDLIENTHKVISQQSFLYTKSDYKTQALTPLSFLSAIAITGKEENGFMQIEGGGWLWADNLAPLNHHQKDMVSTAQLFLNTPYLWGGRTARGIDCSALVQLCASHAGHKIPRDSCDQIEHGETVSRDNIKRNDLVFLEGHVGIMMNETDILNATARNMDVRIEKLDEMEKEYAGGVLDIRRL